MGVNPFTSQIEGKATAEEGEGRKKEVGQAIQVVPHSLETNGSNTTF